MRPEFAIRSLTLAGFTAGGTEMLTLALVARQQAHDPTGMYASGVFVSALAGMAMMGLVGRRFLAFLSPSWLGAGVPALCVGLVGVAAALGPGPADFAVAALVAFVTALDFPNVNATVNRIVSARDRSAAFSTLQSATNLILIVAPVVGAFLISVAGDRKTLVTIALVYLVSASPWLWIPRFEPHAQVAAGESSAFVMVLQTKGLRGLTYCRLLSNLVYAGLPIALPYLLSKVAQDHEAFLWLQASCVSCLRGGLLLASLVGMVTLARRPTLVIPLSILSPVISGVASIVLTLAGLPSVLLACCLVVGVGQFGSRLAGLVLGPSVTPVNRIAEVVLASDTLVRLGSAAYGGVLMLAIASASGSGVPFAIAALGSLAAPAFLGTAFDSYQRQLRSSENAI